MAENQLNLYDEFHKAGMWQGFREGIQLAQRSLYLVDEEFGQK
jgi:hypothetical protein